MAPNRSAARATTRRTRRSSSRQGIRMWSGRRASRCLRCRLEVGRQVVGIDQLVVDLELAQAAEQALALRLLADLDPRVGAEVLQQGGKARFLLLLPVAIHAGGDERGLDLLGCDLAPLLLARPVVGAMLVEPERRLDARVDGRVVHRL